MAWLFRALALIPILFVAACAAAIPPQPAVPPSPADAFMARLQMLCGRAFEGRLVSNDPADADMRSRRLVMHVRECSPTEVRIPFHVGDNRSRTWVIAPTPHGLRLKHDHRHEDGSSDTLTNYGGDSLAPGTETRQEFPADAESIALFTRTDRSVSNTNVWAVEVGGTVFAYELRRPPLPGGRFFRVEFDLSRSVAPPPPPWGAP
jgi:hypothetical protein